MDQKKFFIPINGGRSARHPDSTAVAIWSGIEKQRRRAKIRFIETDDPAVPRFLVDVRSPGNVNRIVDQRQSWPLIFMKGIERKRAATAAIARAGHGNSSGERQRTIC